MNNYCLWSPLTFANVECDGGSGGNLSGMKGTAISTIDKDAVIRKLFSGDNKGCSMNAEDIGGAETCYYSNAETMEVGGATVEPGEEGENISYDPEIDNDGDEEYHSDDEVDESGYEGDDDAAGDETLDGQTGGEDDDDGGSAGTIEVFGTIKRVHGKHNIMIKGNIGYSDEEYVSLSQIPKIVVYAEEDIIIKCNVDRIDALLIAGGTVKTCDSDNLNDKRNSNQLQIFGAVIANKVVPNRTYGAATGANSIIPAEIINFDPSLYLWNKATNDYDDTISGGLEANYVVEVAPRR